MKDYVEPEKRLFNWVPKYYSRKMNGDRERFWLGIGVLAQKKD